MYGSVKNDLILVPECRKCTLPRMQEIHSQRLRFLKFSGCTFLPPTLILIENPKLIKRKGKWTDKCRNGDGTNSWSFRYLLTWTGNVYLYTVREIAFLVGGPLKFNLVLEKSLKSPCSGLLFSPHAFFLSTRVFFGTTSVSTSLVLIMFFNISDGVWSVPLISLT